MPTMGQNSQICCFIYYYFQFHDLVSNVAKAWTCHVYFWSITLHAFQSLYHGFLNQLLPILALSIDELA